MKRKCDLLCLLLCFVLVSCTAAPASSAPLSLAPSAPASAPQPQARSPYFQLAPWFEGEAQVSEQDKEDLAYIHSATKDPPASFLYMSKEGRSAAIAFTDGRQVDFGSYQGEIVGYADISLDGRIVVRESTKPGEDPYWPTTVLLVSVDDNPLQTLTNDFLQYIFLPHKNQIIYSLGSAAGGHLYSWQPGQKTWLADRVQRFVCSSNGEYVLFVRQGAPYLLQVATGAVTAVQGVVPDELSAADVEITPLGVSTNGEQLYMTCEYGEERWLLCAGVDTQTGALTRRETFEDITNVNMHFNYSGTQAIFYTSSDEIWVFSPGRGIYRPDNLPTELYRYIFRGHSWFESMTGITILNETGFPTNENREDRFYVADTSTYAVADFDALFASIPRFVAQKPLNTDVFYCAKTKGGVFIDEEGGLYGYAPDREGKYAAELLTEDAVAYRLSADNSVLYYITDPSIQEPIQDNTTYTGTLWCKRGTAAPKKLAENVCYLAVEDKTAYWPALVVSPDGTKVAFVTGFDLDKKQGELMLAENLGAPRTLGVQVCRPMCVGNDGNVLFLLHSRKTDTLFYNLYDLYLLSGNGTTLLDQDLSLGFYT